MAHTPETDTGLEALFAEGLHEIPSMPRTIRTSLSRFADEEEARRLESLDQFPQDKNQTNQDEAH